MLSTRPFRYSREEKLERMQTAVITIRLSAYMVCVCRQVTPLSRNLDFFFERNNPGNILKKKTEIRHKAIQPEASAKHTN